METTFIPLINPNGAGTVMPVTPQPPIVINNSIGISTQLIIWGMVGFILVELLAIMCLIRYCCRARYIRKRKFKEKEIILSDTGNLNETKQKYFLDRKSTIMTTTAQQIGQEMQCNYAIDEQQSLSSLRPILLTGTRVDNDKIVCHQETIMIDEISTEPRTITPPLAPIYANPPIRSNMYNCLHPTNEEMMGSMKTPNLLANSEKLFATESTNENMHQELSSEDIYTLRFSTSVAPLTHTIAERNEDIINESDSLSISKRYQNSIYNHSLNRPAFEIISHADVRPTTPIKFEHAKDLYEPFHAKKKYKQNTSNPRFCQNEQFHQNQAESLSFGDEKSFSEVGERVEWQMARELTTTDWNQLNDTDKKLPKLNSLGNDGYGNIDDYKGDRVNYEGVVFREKNDYNDPHVNIRNANYKCRCANTNGNKSCSCNSDAKTTIKLLTKKVATSRHICAVDPNIFDSNAYDAHEFNAQSDGTSAEILINQNEINKTNLKFSSSENHQKINNIHIGEDNIVICNLPPPPVQFQQQLSHQVESILQDQSSSRKSSISQHNQTFESRRESIEAFRAYNEIDLNNDLISLYTTKQTNTTELKHMLSDNNFDQNIPYTNKTSNLIEIDPISNASSTVMSTTSAHLY